MEAPGPRWILLVLGCTFLPAAQADVLELKDGNLIECKLVRIEKKGSRGPTLVVKTESGKEKRYSQSRVKAITRTKKTSWEIKAEKKVWYSKKVKKARKGWKAEAKFAKKCAKEGLEDEALAHNRKAYELRKAETPEKESSLLKLVKWLEEVELFEEAQTERRVIYALRKKELAGDAAGHIRLAKWSSKCDLLPEAAEQYEAALAKKPDDKRVGEDLDRIKRQLAIPMDPSFYRRARVRVAAAAEYLRAQQKDDGSIGSDISEAGVQGIRGMTALSAMALMADWDFQIRSGEGEADQIPEELTSALDFMREFEAPNEEDVPSLAGDDVWGPIFALEVFVNCYRRPAFASRRKELRAEIKELLENFKDLQRDDGGWYYYNFIDTSASFVTASALVSLIRAREAGFEIDQEIIDKGAKQIEALKQGYGTYTYSKGLPQGPVGACARSPVCELALAAAGAGKEGSLRRAVDIFLENRPILETLKGSKGTHIGAGRTAPYYLLFAHYWTARAAKHLDRGVRRRYLSVIGGGLLPYQEGDATFGDWAGTKDYKVYGTALAALTMYHIATLTREVGTPGATVEAGFEKEEDEAEPAEGKGTKARPKKPKKKKKRKAEEKAEEKKAEEKKAEK